MKKTFVVFSLAALLGAGMSVPVFSSAQDTDAGSLRAQVNALLAQITDLTKRLGELSGKNAGGSGVSASVVPYEHRICKALYRNLDVGARGDDVKKLQEFLRDKNYLAAEPTGYYGPSTKEAVRKWQASENIATAGVFGPISRERIQYSCGELVRMSAEPQAGEAPLIAMFTIEVGGLRPFTYALDFGDGQILQNIECPMSGSAPERCSAPLVVEHRYEKSGRYTAVLSRSASGGVDVRKAVAKTSIRVGGSTACTKEYSPVCGAKPIVCITTPCNPIPTTYGNTCMMEADGAKFLYSGQCQMTKNFPPVISSFSGPTTLEVGGTGTWIVSAKDPENGALSYSISWGDEAATSPSPGMAADARAFVQTTAFTHAYAAAGVYTITILVQDNAGLQAKTSATVRIVKGETACTLEYNPVCGRPAGCENTCSPGMYCTMICKLPEPKTYSNKCFLAAENATLLHEGACTPASGNM